MSLLGSTRLLAEFAADLRGEAVPQPVRALLGDLLLDFVRVASIGAEMPWSTWANGYTQRISAAGRSRILFSKDRLDPVHATFLNTTYAGSIDSDDTHVGSMLHPGSIVFSAALAVGQDTDAKGPDVLAAIVAGYETMIRTALSIQPTHFRRGFQSTSTCGGFGSAAAAARIQFAGKDAAQCIAETFGMVASFAGGLTQFYRSGSTVKRIHAAHAAENGVAAALMVANGFDGPVDIFEGENGFAKAYADGFDPVVISKGLGSEFRLMEVTVKSHASSARVQAAVDAMLELRRKFRFAASDIRRIRIGIPGIIQGRLTLPHPVDLQAGQMSLPFCVAIAALLDRPNEGTTLSIRDFDRWLGDPATAELQDMIVCELDPEVEAATTPEAVPAKLKVELISGVSHETFVDAPKGSPSKPYSSREHAERFVAEVAPRLGEKSCEAIVEASRDMTALDVKWLGEALSGIR